MGMDPNSKYNKLIQERNILEIATLILWKVKLDAPPGSHVLIWQELKNTHQASTNFEVFHDVADQAHAGDSHLH